MNATGRSSKRPGICVYNLVVIPNHFFTTIRANRETGAIIIHLFSIIAILFSEGGCQNGESGTRCD
jgi:hypothetical protein